MHMPIQNPHDLPAPKDKVSRIHAFAYDLAYGAVNGLWDSLFEANGGRFADEDSKFSGLAGYLSKKWEIEVIVDSYVDPETGKEEVLINDFLDYPSIQLLVSYGYFQPVPFSDSGGEYYRLTEKAFSQLEKPPSASVFISYNRRQSSTFALLILNVFKKEGLEAFLDVRNIAPGDDWHGLIEEEVKKRENFIVLLNRITLKSKYVRQEIRWAIESGTAKRIIPIFHGGLKPKNFKDDEFQELLAKNAIIVEQETAIAYESALLQLLNYFGRTP